MDQCCKTCRHFKVEMVPWTEGAMGECSRKYTGEIQADGSRRTLVHNAPAWGTACPLYEEKTAEQQVAENLAGVWSVEGHRWIETDRTPIVFKKEYMNDG